MEKLTATLPGSLQVGKDGISPVVQVSDIAGGHRITITDVNGTISFDVPDGKDGKSAYDYAIEAGYTGDSNTFANALVEALNGDGIVRSINGVAADENGNVDVVLPHFDLAAMGLPALAMDGTEQTALGIETTNVAAAAQNGDLFVSVSVTVSEDADPVSFKVPMTPVSTAGDTGSEIQGEILFQSQRYLLTVLIGSDWIRATVSEIEAGSSTLTGSGAPTNNTEAEVGRLYMDTDTGTLYMCTTVFDGNGYIWVSVSRALVVTLSDSREVASSDAGQIFKHISNGGTALLYDGTRYITLAHCSEASAFFSARYDDYVDPLYIIDDAARVSYIEMITVSRTEFQNTIGNISTALDHIITLQEELIGS